jgi:subtilisin family serine protease
MTRARNSIRLASIGAALLLCVGAAWPAMARSSTSSAVTPVSKLQGGLARLVAHPTLLDPRLPALVAGYLAGEIPAFALVDGQVTPARLSQLVARGARVLRTYRSLPLVALAASPQPLLSIAGLPWVSWMSPIEVVVALDAQPMVDQAHPPTGTPIDLSVPTLWKQGITGSGVRIAILDTGMELTQQDLDDLDFRRWNDPPNLPGLGNPAKVVDARNFNGGACAAPSSGGFDGHGHGTHVAGIAAGTGEGDPSTNADDGRVMGMAPDAQLGIGKVLTDAGAGINSDLIAAMEWAALPAGSGSAQCPSIGAQVVNLSLGSDARPLRLNTGHDVDAVSLALNHLAATYGTLFVSAAGNSGPYLGSVLEAPGGASQALSVGATAKDWDLNHDATASGDTCAGYVHEKPTCPQAFPGTQGSSLAPFSSHGVTEGRFLKPDVTAPGLNILSAQGTAGAALAASDLNMGTRNDPFYATASGTSMASPATAGVAALLVQGYRDRYATLPSGPSGVAGVKARSYVLLRAALMNTAASGLRDARWMLTTDNGTIAAATACPPTPDPLVPLLCSFKDIITGSLVGSVMLAGERNAAGDPFVGPLGEGAGKIQPVAALRALRDGVVVYRGASSAAAATNPVHQEFEGSWELGDVLAGTTEGDPFVLRAAPGAPALTARFSFLPGHPSDGTRSIPTSGPGAWSVALPGATSVPAGASRTRTFSLHVPGNAPAGIYTGVVQVTVSNGQVLRIPVLASVPLHDPVTSAGNVPGAQARIASAMDVFAKGDTVWPSVVGQANGAMADWATYPVQLGSGLARARFTAWDSAAGDETYDLYLYRDAQLIASTHPFTTPGSGVTDEPTNNARGPTSSSSPQVLELTNPAPGRYVVVVNRARVGTVNAITGDFGSYVVTLDEIRP